MPRHILHELTITAFAALLIVSTLGMVITVSADRSEPEPEPISFENPTKELDPPPLPLDYPPTAEILVIDVSGTKPTQPATSSVAVSNSPNTLPQEQENGLHSDTTAKPNPTPLLKTNKLAVSTETKSESFNSAFVKRIFELTNDYRNQEGLTSLQLSPSLTKNATKYSSYMLATRRMNHTDLLGCDLACRFLRDGFTARSWGENLAHYSFSEEPTVEEVAQFFMREWKKSAGHKANLVSPVYLETGIGIARDDASIYVAVHFALP